MKLGSRVFTAGNRTRYTIDYSNWLEPGETLTLLTVVLAPEFTATVSDITIEVPAINNTVEGVFYLEGGTVDEVFTVNIHAETTRDEEKNDTADFTVIAP